LWQPHGMLPLSALRTVLLTFAAFALSFVPGMQPSPHGSAALVVCVAVYSMRCASACRNCQDVCGLDPRCDAALYSNENCTGPVPFNALACQYDVSIVHLLSPPYPIDANMRCNDGIAMIVSKMMKYSIRICERVQAAAKLRRAAAWAMWHLHDKSEPTKQVDYSSPWVPPSCRPLPST
jgi:hypothetical protein